MVHVRDEGSHFDVPIDRLWKFLQDPEAHGGSHRSTRNQSMKPLSDTSMILSMEQKMNGNWVKVSNRITVLPPLGLAIEVLEGPMAGSKIVNVYTPKGEKTGIDVYGEFVSKQVPEHQLEGMARGFLAEVFEEDAATLKNYHPK
ncbi:MAG TPA: hypothetical protein VGV64_07430 [Thermoplasmata archaeon]|nr:hypothetical protein [Thermoplasmata archaeon]